MPDMDRKLPEWAPPEGGEGFASNVMPGVEGGHDGAPGSRAARSVVRQAPPRRREYSVEELADGVRRGDRVLLSKAITLVESNAPAHIGRAQELLKLLMADDPSQDSVRIGITGIPGVGKSTVIEALGSSLCEQGHRVAVLAVDPTSSVSRGSVLGDKTRMEKLAQNPAAFIRPSPTSGTLGGVTRKSRETIVLCEAAGFDVIIVETVGVGQSEVTVRSMVDFFMVLMIAGAGDELQGIKKGVIELADALFINKADGDNVERARRARAECANVLKYLPSPTPGWKTPAKCVSGRTGEGIETMWEVVQDFVAHGRESGSFESRRRDQNISWMRHYLEETVLAQFYAREGVKERMASLEQEVLEGNLPPTLAVQKLLAGDQAAGATAVGPGPD